MPKRTATWNPQTQLWETDQADLFSGQQEPFSETWPTSGMTRSGALLPLPTSGHPTGESECSSLLPTPNASDTSKHSGHPPEKRVGHNLRLTDVTEHLEKYRAVENGLLETGGLLPTPRATDGTKGGPNQRGSSGDLMLPSAVMQM